MILPRLLSHSYLIILILSQSLYSVYGQSASNNTKNKSLDEFILKQMVTRHIPGLQLAIVQQGKLVKLSNYGLANIQDSIPVDNQTLFPINSITKALVGVAIMQLVEANKLTLDAPVSTYLDSLPASWQSTTIRQLLTHTSGLPNIMTNNEKMIREGEEKQAWAFVQTQPMDFAPGERFGYNQTNYLLLGKIIDKLANTPFTQFIQQQQLNKVGMKRTRFADDHDVIPHSVREYTFFHNVDGRVRRTEPIGNVFEEFPPFLRTASGMSSTAKELADWINALTRNQLLSAKNSLTTLWTPGLLNNGSPSGFSRLLNGYALGSPIIIRAEHRAIAPIGGGRSAIFYYPDDELGVIVLTNLQGSSPESFADEIAGYFLPDMRAINGFGASANIKQLSQELNKRGFAKAQAIVNDLKKKNIDYKPEENELNSWGYQLLNLFNTSEAVEIFKLNVSLYPESANTYDSLAEAYEQAGNKSLAIENYQTSLRLNPKNAHAEERLKLLRVEK